MADITLAVNRSVSLQAEHISPSRARVLLNAAEPLDRILKEDNLRLRVTVGDWSSVFGAHEYSGGTPELVFDDYWACLKALRSCRLYTFASLFFSGQLRIAGSIERAIDVLYSVNIKNDTAQSTREKLARFSFSTLKAWLPWFARKFESNFHYSLDARAYELFLDRYLQYTCGRFLATTTSLDDAQIEKFDLINEWMCEYLGTTENKKHLDIGCGWGGLISYFRNNYKTKSIGITNCVPQRDYVSNTLGADAVLLGDFTRISDIPEKFDFVTVIGMSEHVVGDLKDRLLKQIWGCLNDNGMLYFQTIAKPDVWIGGDAYRIAQELIFPGHDLDFQGRGEARFVSAGFKIVHMEDHSIDYAHTTREWAKRITQNFSKFEALLGLKNASLFLLYLLYASKLFENGRGKLLRYALVKERV